VAPRFATEHHQNSFNPHPVRRQTFIKAGSLTFASAIDGRVGAALAQRGHQLTVTDEPIASPVMLAIDQSTGKFSAAGDPKANRHAAGV
jgi:hypothetical protein